MSISLMLWASRILTLGVLGETVHSESHLVSGSADSVGIPVGRRNEVVI